MKKQIRQTLDALASAKRIVTVTRHSRARDSAFLAYTSQTGVLETPPYTTGEYRLVLSDTQYCSFSERAVRCLGSSNEGHYVISLR